MAPTFFQKLARATTASASRERTSSESVGSAVLPNIVTTRPDDLNNDHHDDAAATVQHQASFDSNTVTIIPPSPLAANKDLEEDNTSMASNLVPGSFLRKQTSNKSLKTTELQVNTETTANNNNEEAVIESPTELQPPMNSLSDPRPTFPPASIGLQPATTTASMLSLASSDASTTTNNKKRPWKRSTTRKPTGLASAIAASGLTIANPTLSSVHSAHAAAQISPPPTIPNTPPPLPITASSSQKSGKTSSIFLGNGRPSSASPALGSPPYLSRSPAAHSSSVSLMSSSNNPKNRSSSNLNKNTNPADNLSPKSNKSDRSSSRHSKQQRGLSPAPPPPPPPLPPRPLPTGGSRSRRSSRAAKSDAGASDYSTVPTPSTSFFSTNNASSVNGDGADASSRYPEYFELDADTSSSSGSAGSVGQMSDDEHDVDDDNDNDNDNDTNNTNNDNDSHFSASGFNNDNENNDVVVSDHDDLVDVGAGKHGSSAGLGSVGAAGGFVDIPVTGFAVASMKRNQDFHELFQSVPEGDYLIEDYGCALQREILIQGRIYISENHICFHANIFGWITDLSIPVYEITSIEKKMTAFVIPNAIQITTRQTKYTFTSFLARDTTFDVLYNIWRLGSSIAGTATNSSGRPSVEEYVDGRPPSAAAAAAAAVPPRSAPLSGEGIRAASRASAGGQTAAANANGAGAIVAAVVGAKNKVAPAKVATECACGREGRHYPEVAMEIVIPGTPEKIHNLIFASGFMKEFMAEDQKLLDIQMSDWAPVSSPNANANANSTTTTATKLLTRNMSYIKPLAGSLGPKQTKCEIKDEMEHVDLDSYISTLTTTRTPDVPSGGAFSVKNRTCVTWAGPLTSKVLVTSQVEWTGRSFIKGIIEKSAMDGQRQYHGELERAMRGYIRDHRSEFLPEGVEPAAVAGVGAVLPEGPSTTAAAAAAAAAAADAVLAPTTTTQEGPPTPTTASELKRFRERERERQRNARGLQWAWDTFEGAYQVGRRSAKGALELVRDAWDQSSSGTVLWFLIVGLVVSNLWTLMRMGRSGGGTGSGGGGGGGGGRRGMNGGNLEDDGAAAMRRMGLARMEERERWVKSIVAALWEKEMGAQQQLQLQQQVQQAAATTPLASASVSVVHPPPPSDDPPTTTTTTPTEPVTTPPTTVLDDAAFLKEEVRVLQETLKTLEERVSGVRERLDGYYERLVGLD